MKQEVAFEYEGRSYTVEVERSGDTLVIESEGQRYEVTLSGAVRQRSGPSPAPAAEQAPVAAAASSPASPPSAATPAPPRRQWRRPPPRVPPAALLPAMWWLR